MTSRERAGQLPKIWGQSLPLLGGLSKSSDEHVTIGNIGGNTNACSVNRLLPAISKTTNL